MAAIQFRKLPVVISAARFDGTAQGYQDVCDAFPEAVNRILPQFVEGDPNARTLLVVTLEGGHRADAGDWIIRGVKGEFYPCKPDIFAMTYERVDDTQPRS